MQILLQAYIALICRQKRVTALDRLLARSWSLVVRSLLFSGGNSMHGERSSRGGEADGGGREGRGGAGEMNVTALLALAH